MMSRTKTFPENTDAVAAPAILPATPEKGHQIGQYHPPDAASGRREP